MYTHVRTNCMHMKIDVIYYMFTYFIIYFKYLPICVLKSDVVGINSAIFHFSNTIIIKTRKCE